MGIDPGDVRLHRGAAGAEVASAHGADAVTVGQDIFLAPGQGEMDPRGMGLLAHELTHIALRRQLDAEPAARGGNTADNDSSGSGADTGYANRSNSADTGYADDNSGPDTGYAHDTDYADRSGGDSGHGGRRGGRSGHVYYGHRGDTRPGSTGGESSHERSDDELAARQVEANVRSLAEWASGGAAFQAGPSSAGSQSAGTSSSAPGPAGASTSAPGGGASGAMAGSASNPIGVDPTLTGAATGAAADRLEASQGAWNGLPAPWEPWPDWLTTPAPTGAAHADAAVTRSAAAGVTSRGSSGASAAGSRSTQASSTGYAAPMADVAAPMADAADIGRDLPTADSPTAAMADQPASPPAHAAGVEPDLDALARQVYTMLRRRLASEQRRFN